MTDVVVGNAPVEGRDRGGWFLGHFIQPADDPRCTSDVEIKWGVHSAGEQRAEWSVNQTATTISVLIQGRFRLQFRDRDHVLSQTGDYALWLPGVAHCWIAEEDSTILTVRYPSLPQDSIGQPPQAT